MPIVLLILLIALNIPLFLLIAWVIFDTKDAAADTIWETVVALLQILLIPKIIRVLFDMDDSGALGLFPIAAFFIFCIAAVTGEYYLLSLVAPGLFPWPK